MPRRLAAVLTPLGLALTLGGCVASDLFDRYFGGPVKTPLPGERTAVLAEENKVEPDPRVADVPVDIVLPVINAAWPQPGGGPNHVMPHLEVGGFDAVWRVSIGSGNNRSGRVTASPVIADGRVFAMDAGTRLVALDAATGATQWRIDVEPPGSRSTGAGGGVAVVGGRAFVATGQAQVLAVDAATGRELWRTTVTAPMRGGPTVAGNRVFAISIDNQVHALDAETGRKLWSHAGITETAGIYGTSSPAVDGNVVVASFSSGEIYALRADNGRVLWAESLASLLKSDAVSSLSDVRGLPAIDRGVIYAISHAGLMAAIDLRGGGRIWESSVGSMHTPWLAGDFIFVTTVDGEVVAVRRRDGRVRWVRALERFTDPNRKRGRIVWTGPILVSGRVLVANSLGQVVTFLPEDGTILERLKLPDGVALTPVVANRMIYVLTEGGDIVAMR
jgi:outer membrane protein assembly factor BamB